MCDGQPVWRGVPARIYAEIEYGEIIVLNDTDSHADPIVLTSITPSTAEAISVQRRTGTYPIM